ncbi:YihY/virulence factor BrkB family protein [Paenibacillus xerothermodurans]|uniref:YihY/virulence factor BrkB family protein n=1 Tax=Paenibacillus xerothermodurans TaxID=1977292 RepID=A0A2W1NCR2_PAEXE|nr:YihY/virulence factor BrkB family protein [Paenibacillus xerothermodurans]PZE20851.1 YihY/virulence factor BrkB family protein [Paenibacillus xerothermodurans]
MATNYPPAKARPVRQRTSPTPGSRAPRNTIRDQPKMGLRTFAENLYCRIQDDEVPAMGAQLTYYLILSFFPFLMFIIAVLSFSNMTAQDVIQGMTRVLPDLSMQTILDVFAEIQQSRSGSLLSVGLIATIWSASNGINAVMKSLNKAYDVEEERPYWKVKGLSIIATIVMAAVILCSMLLLIFGKIIGEAIYKLVHLPGSFDTIWSVAQYVIPLLVIATVFMLLYRYIPNLRLTFKEVLPGAVFATCGWLLTSVLFSFYVNNFGNYTKMYGSIGGIIVLLIWLYLSSVILILGGEINATLHFDKKGLKKTSCKKFALSVPFGRKKQDKDGKNTGTGQIEKMEKRSSDDSKPLYP